jgi:ELWxxDGT repeat protein
MKHIFTLFFLLTLTLFSSAQGIEAITNINYYGGDGFDPQEITVCNGSLFFFGPNTDSFFNNLYISDGSTVGTTLVKRIDGSPSVDIGRLAALNTKLIFSRNVYSNYTGQLWSSDGTAAGTLPYAAVITATNLFEMNGKLYFGGADTIGQTLSNYHDQLWVTDGTAAGTTLVKTINPTGPAGIRFPYVYNGHLYFTANDGVHGQQLWISDGTAAGTMLLKNIYNAETILQNFIPYNGKLYFSAYDSILGDYPMGVTDGTMAGTNAVSGFPAFTFYNPIVYNNKIYFSGKDSTGSAQLWSTDGTGVGTSLVHAEASSNNANGFSPFSFTILNGMLYMLASDSAYDTEVWKSDGTSAGTQIITHAVYGGVYSAFPTNLTTLGNKLVFVGWDTAAGLPLNIGGIPNVFISDGTEAGTLSYPLPGEYNTDFRSTSFIPYKNALYYNASYFTTLDYQLNEVYLSNVGISEVGISTMSIYPNPANDHLIIKSDKAISSVMISDISGRVIFSSASFTGNSIQTSSFSSGLYLIRATDDQGQIHAGKFVKE